MILVISQKPLSEINNPFEGDPLAKKTADTHLPLFLYPFLAGHMADRHRSAGRMAAATVFHAARCESVQNRDGVHHDGLHRIRRVGGAGARHLPPAAQNASWRQTPLIKI